MDKKLMLSKSLTGVFAALTVVLAAAGFRIVDLVCLWYDLPRNTLGNVLLVSGYVCAAIALATLVEIYGLLSAIARGEVFTSANVRRIRMMAYLCAGAGVVSVIDFAVTKLLFIVMIGFCALFMGLLVHVVGDAFDSALRMKNELDLTI